MSTLVVFDYNDRCQAGEVRLYKVLLHVASMEVIGC